MTQHVVYRYPVEVTDQQIITMPTGAEILHIARRDGTEDVDMWALVDPDAAPQIRYFRVAGTGHPLANARRLRHIGTFQLRQGALVFHLFEGERWEDLT